VNNFQMRNLFLFSKKLLSLERFVRNITMFLGVFREFSRKKAIHS